MVAANAQTAVAFHLSPGQAGDAPEGRKLLEYIGNSLGKCSVLMDRAYEGDDTRKLVRSLGYKPVVPPKKNRAVPWKYSKKLYKKRNEVERLFRRLKGFRRVATRYDKLDVMFIGFVVMALIVMGLKDMKNCGLK
jgi:transposase